MGTAAAGLSGPDLARGLPLSDLADGTMLLGHALGESVLVARRGAELFAIGATCTHYGGPLAEGLLVGDTVRCPWHHACFSLRTGEALRAPALNPVASWKVEQRDGLFYVTEKVGEGVRPPVEAPAPEPAAISSIVIVGAGAAGHAAAETLRREGYAGRLLLLGADEAPPYDRPNLSKDYLAGTAPEDWIPLRPPAFYDEHGIDLVLGVRVSAVEPEAKEVRCSDGRSYPYDRLLLATGAAPVRLPLPGGDLPHVFYLRTLADSRAIIARAQEARRAVVLGASFIGMEVAASLRTRGLDVHVVAPGGRPMENVLGPALGDFIRALHEEHGVVFHLGQTATAIGADEVVLSGGETLAADLVVVGVGVHPDLTLAEAAGLEVDGGVLVDEYLQTSSPGIFAAGDIARYPDRRSGERIRVEHWVLAQRQGQTAARNMLGRREPFAAAPFFWSQYYDVPVNYVGHAPAWDQADVTGSIEGRDCLVAYRSKGRILAVATIYRDRENLEAEVALEAGDEATLERLAGKA